METGETSQRNSYSGYQVKVSKLKMFIIKGQFYVTILARTIHLFGCQIVDLKFCMCFAAEYAALGNVKEECNISSCQIAQSESHMWRLFLCNDSFVATQKIFLKKVIFL